MPPRASPVTTVPSTSTGLPSRRAAPSTSPSASELADPARRHAVENRNRQRLEAEPAQELQVSRAATAEPEVLPRDDDLGADRAQHFLGELLGLEPGEVEGELDDERRLHAELLEELEAPLERSEELDPVAEGRPRVGIEGDDGRLGAGRERGLDDPPVAEVDAVERPERDGPRAAAQLRRCPRDLHASSAASASSAGMIRSGSASATSKGPTWVRLRLTQWPPRASATARTYPPELRRIARRATGSS